MALPSILRRRAPWIGLLIAVAAYYPRFISEDVGMTLYSKAADCVLHGAALRQCADIFTYPPAFAFVMIPFVPLSMGLRMLVWYVISIGASVGCFAFSEKLVLCLFPGPWTDRQLAWLRGATVLLSLKFVLAVLEYQAYDTLMIFFALVGIWGIAKRRDAVAGCGLAMAAAIKATPLIFLPYLLLKRRFFAAAIFTVAFIVLSFLPDALSALKGMSPRYFETWARLIVTPAITNDPGGTIPPYWHTWMAVNILNHSFRGVVLRLTQGTSFASHSDAILYALCAGYLALIGLLLFKTSKRDDFVAVDGSILLISMLMLSPMSSRYHFVALVLPYMVAAAFTLRDSALRIAGIVTLTVSFVLATATSNDLSGQFLTEWSYAHNFLALGSLVLLVFFAFVIWTRLPGMTSEFRRPSHDPASPAV